NRRHPAILGQRFAVPSAVLRRSKLTTPGPRARRERLDTCEAHFFLHRAKAARVRSRAKGMLVGFGGRGVRSWRQPYFRCGKRDRAPGARSWAGVGAKRTALLSSSLVLV